MVNPSDMLKGAVDLFRASRVYDDELRAVERFGSREEYEAADLRAEVARLRERTAERDATVARAVRVGR